MGLMLTTACVLLGCGDDDSSAGSGGMDNPYEARDAYVPPSNDMGMGGAGGMAGSGGEAGMAGSGGMAGTGGMGGTGGMAGSGGMAGTGGMAGAGGEAGMMRMEVPQTGEILITEILFDPHDGLVDETAEWIELYNPQDIPVSLEGCTLSDGTAESPLGDVNLDPGGYALFGRSDDPTVNGGLDMDGVFLFALNNSRDRIVLTCDGEISDVVHYDFDEGFPRPAALISWLQGGKARRRMTSCTTGALHAHLSVRILFSGVPLLGTMLGAMRRRMSADYNRP